MGTEGESQVFSLLFCSLTFLFSFVCQVIRWGFNLFLSLNSNTTEVSGSGFHLSLHLPTCAYAIRSDLLRRKDISLGVISLYQDAQCSKFTHNHHNKLKQGGCVSAEKHKSVHSYYIWNAASCQVFFMSLEIRLKISPKSDS